MMSLPPLSREFTVALVKRHLFNLYTFKLEKAQRQDPDIIM